MKKKSLITTAALALSLTTLTPITSFAATETGTNVLNQSENQPIETNDYKMITTVDNNTPVWSDLKLWKNKTEEPGAWVRASFGFYYVKEKNAYVINCFPGLQSPIMWNEQDGVGNLIINGGEFPLPDTDAQYWLLEPADKKDTYYIKNKLNPNYVLDVHNYNIENGTPLKAEKKHGPNDLNKAAQIFKLEKK